MEHHIRLILLGLLANLSATAQASNSANLNWQACTTAPSIQCAATQVPLDWNNPAGQQISYFVRRVPAPTQPARRVLVYLAGGPGASDDAGIRAAAALQALLPDMDVVAPDHRGTGLSTWLGCNPSNPLADLTSTCINQVVAQYGSQLGSYFSVTQSAQDIEHLIDNLRTGGAPVYLYGESYGTFLVNRYLNMYPSGVDGAVLDSVVRPDGHGPFLPGSVDLPPNHVAHQTFDACGADPFCAGKLGNDPWSTLAQLHQKLAAGFCSSALPAGASDASSLLKNALNVLGQTFAGAAQPALVYRLNRCSPPDIAAINHFNAAGSAPVATGGSIATGEPPSPGLNQLLFFNIELSDMFSLHPPLADLAAADASAYVSDLTGDNAFLQAFSSWPLPLYSPGIPRQWAATTVPLLLLVGTLDIQTPAYVLNDATTSFTAPHQQLVVIPNAMHVTAEHSPATASTAGRPCGLQLIGEFLQAPTGPLNTQCTREIPALDFHGDLATAQSLFGSADLYENLGPAIAPSAIVNAASPQAGLSPGALMSIYGTDLAASAVTVNGHTAPASYVSQTQINAQIPTDLVPGSATVAVTANGQTTTQSISLATASPGIFTDPLQRVLPTRTARPGDTATMLITGQGPLSPSLQPTLPLTITVGGIIAQVLSVAASSAAPGVTQIDFRIPNSVPVGNQPVAVSFGSYTSPPATLTITN